MRQPKVWVSILILLIIGLHALPVLSYQGQSQTRWPILTWAMYAKSLPPGPIQAMRRHIVGVTSEGNVDTVQAHDLGLSRFAHVELHIQPLWRGDTAVARELIRRLNRGLEDSVVQLRLHTEVHRVSGGEIERVDLPVKVYSAIPQGNTGAVLD